MARRYQQVNMIAHKHVRMYVAASVLRGTPEHVQVDHVVGHRKKAVLAIVASLNNMHRNIGNDQARAGGHDGTRQLEGETTLIAPAAAHARRINRASFPAWKSGLTLVFGKKWCDPGVPRYTL